MMEFIQLLGMVLGALAGWFVSQFVQNFVKRRNAKQCSSEKRKTSGGMTVWNE